MGLTKPNPTNPPLCNRLEAIRGDSMTAEEARQAAVLGWAIEWVSGRVRRWTPRTDKGGEEYSHADQADVIEEREATQLTMRIAPTLPTPPTLSCKPSFS
jgi:hypothetical protein